MVQMGLQTIGVFPQWSITFIEFIDFSILRKSDKSLVVLVSNQTLCNDEHFNFFLGAAETSADFTS